MKTFESIISVFFIILINQQILVSLNPKVIKNDPLDSDDYCLLIFQDDEYGTNITLVSDMTDTYFISRSSLDSLNGFLSGTNTISLENLKYKRTFIDRTFEQGLEVYEYVIEVRDTTNANAFGLIYLPKDSLGTPLTQAELDTLNSYKPLLDSAFAADNPHMGPASLLDFSGPRIISVGYYAISFDQPDPYQSGYTTGELDYEYVYQNSSTDYLEKILDTDRSDKLVGFRYYSDLNNQLYTIFIEPNN
jgi:hypothetical protein